MVSIERIIVSAFLVLAMSILLMIGFYHIFLFGAEGGFTNSISVRLLIAGTCFNLILFGVISYLVIQVRLLMRLAEKLQEKKEEKPVGMKEKVIQTLRGRTSSKGTSINSRSREFTY